MTNLTETPTWDAGVYQFAITDPIQGGPGGIDNQPHQSLVDRTLWLRNRIAAAIIQSGQADSATDNQQLVEAVVLQVAHVPALRTVPVPLVPVGQTVLVLTRGQASDGDGFSATYKWSGVSTAADNGSSVVAPSTAPSAGRWLVCGINANALGGQLAAYYATAATVAAAIAPLAPRDSPIFTGDPTAPNPPATDATNRLATTGWVNAEFIARAGIGLVWNGTGGTYFKLATLPASSPTTADSINLKATLNVGSLAANDTMLEGIFGNRGGFSYVYNLYGPNAVGTAIVCYAETDGTTSVYAVCTAPSGFATITILNSGVPGTANSSTLYPTPPSTTAPTGVLVFNSGATATYPPALTVSLAATLAAAETYAAAQAAAATAAAEAYTNAKVAPLATSASVTSLAATVAADLTAAKTYANGTQNLRPNGWKMDPDGFMRIWGEMTIAASGGTAINFATECGAAFPSACCGVQLTTCTASDSGIIGGLALGVPFVYNVSKAGFSADNLSGATINTYWHAVGF